MSRFQLIFTGILVFCAVVGAVLFAVARSSGSKSAPQVILWGTAPSSLVSSFMSKVSATYRDTVNVAYVQKNPATFESELIANLARGQGPDLLLVPQDLLIKQLDKYYVVPYQSYSERLFKDSFVPEGELYLGSGGVIGFPFTIDPMVMYWNRSVFQGANVALPPTSWTDLYALAPKIVQKDENGNITQALIAFGSTNNVSHSKDLISLLSLQAGSPIVDIDSTGQFESAFAKSGTGGLVPAEQAVNFFTEFSNPVKPAYSWNRSMPNDRDAFVSGKLALYFGYASELPSIRAANPNLDFDVALVPQVPGRKATFGQMSSLVILKASPNVGAAFTAAVTLTGADLQAEWSKLSGYPPVRRDLLSTPGLNAYQSVFYDSSLMARAWLDPYREATDDIFKRLIDNVTSGKLRTSESVRSASLEIDSLFRSSI